MVLASRSKERTEIQCLAERHDGVVREQQAKERQHALGHQPCMGAGYEHTALLSVGWYLHPEAKKEQKLLVWQKGMME